MEAALPPFLYPHVLDAAPILLFWVSAMLGFITLNPKPETRIPKPETLNPKPLAGRAGQQLQHSASSH